MAGLSPYHYIAATATLVTILGVAMRWYHRREATTAKADSLDSKIGQLCQRVDALTEKIQAHEVKVAENYIHREDFVVAFTRLDHKVDKILSHIAMTKT